MIKQLCGYIGIVGRPNVGKSTLLNRLLGRKISITSNKPQTTQRQILGIKTKDNIQAIFVDTPGIYLKAKHRLHRYMDRESTTAIKAVDVIIFMIEAEHWTEEDELVLSKLKKVETPVILVINKVDSVKDKKQLLPRLELLRKKMSFADIIPLSAVKGTNIDVLEQVAYRYLPEGGHLFPSDQITDKDDQFIASEIIREKIIRQTGQEVPYGVNVIIDSFKKETKIWRIEAIIQVERKGQKLILIGKKGEKLKEIGTLARKSMEKLFNQKVYLNLWVKVKKHETKEVS